MTQQIDRLPGEEDETTHVERPTRPVSRMSRLGIVAFLSLACLLMVLFAGLSLQSSSLITIRTHAARASVTRTVRPTNNASSPLVAPGQQTSPRLQLVSQQYLVYEQANGLYVTSTMNGTAQQLLTPGYVYNRAIPPIVTADGKVLYTGDGLWLTDIFNGSPQQIATLPKDQVITSLALSSDGSTVAWSTEPVNGIGETTIYAGPLQSSTPIYTHDATDCPCYRVFSFLHQGTGSVTSDSILLLTDDRGDHHSVQYGLWTLNLADTPLEIPQPLLDGNAPQGPLALSPDGKLVLYSSFQGVVPTQNDGSVPPDIEGLNYANSMSIAPITISRMQQEVNVTLGMSQDIISAQRDQTNEADYHWIATPLFSADSHVLIYVEFSTDVQAPFTRHSALYLVHINKSANRLTLGKPQLIETANVPYIELGTWLNNTILTFYAGGNLYALNSSDGALTQLVQAKTYARAIGVWNPPVEGEDS